MTDQCNVDFGSMDHDELVAQANYMHQLIHEYDDSQEQIRQWVASLGYAIDTTAGEVAKFNRLGRRKIAMGQIPAHLANFATLAYRFAGITRADLLVAKEFADIVDNFDMTAPDKE